MIFDWLLRPRRRDAVHRLYLGVVEQARRPAFYSLLGVPDTLDGRFDLIMLHAFLVFNRLKSGGGDAGRLGQDLFDVMFGDMDRSLRELGVGDLSVGKRVKQMVTAFYGRMEAYETALSDGGGTLAEALERNIYRGEPPGALEVSKLAAYVRGETAGLAKQDLSDIVAGRIRFGTPPGAGNSSPDRDDQQASADEEG